MANILRSFLLCGTGGLEELQTTGGTPTVGTTVNTGERSYELLGAATENYISLDVPNPSGVAVGENYTVIAVLRFSDVAPGTNYIFLEVAESNRSNPSFRVRLDTDGDVTIEDSTASIIGTITAPLTVDTWHTFRVDVDVGNGTDGTLKLTIDDGTPVSGSCDTFSTSSASDLNIRGAESGDGTIYVDTAAVWDTDTTFAPTDLPATIGKAIALSDETTDTDQGTVLTSGTWDDVNNFPWTGTGEAAYTALGASGATDTNGGTYQGPAGNSALSGGTILGSKCSWTLRRGSGSGTTHTIYWGDDGAAYNAQGSKTVTLDTSAGYFEDTFETYTPAITEHFRQGFGKSGGGREIYCADMVAGVLYEPAATSTFTGSADQALPAIGQSATGTFGPDTSTGSASQALPAIDQSAAGTFVGPVYTGSASQALPAIDQAAAGTFGPGTSTGTAAQALPGFAQVAVGTFGPDTSTGSASQALPGFAQSATGTFAGGGGTFTGAIAQALPAIGQSAAGTFGPDTSTGTAAQALPGLGQSAVGTFGPDTSTGSASQALPGFAQSATGTFAGGGGTFTGVAAQALPGLAQSAAGTFAGPVYTGVAAQALPSLSQSVAGTFGPDASTGAAAQALPGFAQAAAGTFGPDTSTGVAVQALPGLTQSATGTVSNNQFRMYSAASTIASTSSASTIAGTSSASPFRKMLARSTMTAAGATTSANQTSAVSSINAA